VLQPYTCNKENLTEGKNTKNHANIMPSCQLTESKTSGIAINLIPLEKALQLASPFTHVHRLSGINVANKAVEKNIDKM